MNTMQIDIQHSFFLVVGVGDGVVVAVVVLLLLLLLCCCVFVVVLKSNKCDTCLCSPRVVLRRIPK